MERWWRFLQHPGNRDVLAWLGGGLVVAVAGLWTVVVHLDQPEETPHVQSRPNVEAREGGVAVGGDITDSTIRIEGVGPAPRDEAPAGEDDAPPAE